MKVFRGYRNWIEEKIQCSVSVGVCLEERKCAGVVWGRGKKGVGQELSQKACSEEAD